MSEAAAASASTSPFARYQPEPPVRETPVSVSLAPASPAEVEELAALQVGVRGELAGYSNVTYLSQHPIDDAPAGYYLTGVSVSPRWRRRGIGGALTRWRMDWAWRRAPEVWCFVSARNPASLDLHRMLGFAEVRRAASLQGVGFDGGAGVLLRAGRPD